MTVDDTNADKMYRNNLSSDSNKNRDYILSKADTQAFSPQRNSEEELYPIKQHYNVRTHQNNATKYMCNPENKEKYFYVIIPFDFHGNVSEQKEVMIIVGIIKERTNFPSLLQKSFTVIYLKWNIIVHDILWIVLQDLRTTMRS